MLEQSKEYLAAVKSPQRQVNAKFTLNNRVFGGTKLAKLDYDQAIVSGTSYTFGGAYVARLTLEIKELVEGIQEMMPATAEIGISVDGAMEYKPIGQFFVTDIELDRNTNSTKLKLQDGFCKLNGEYQSRLSYPTTARAVFSEICQRCNISTMPMNIPDTIILGTKLGKTSYREAIKYIAQLVGSYAIFNRKGQLEFRNIQKLSYRVNRDNYVMGGFKRKEIQFRLNGIECEVSNNQKLITGTSSGNVAKLNNPWMTQMYLDELFSKVQGFQFYPYSLNFQGDPCLDVGDWIEVEYAKGEYFQAPILVQKISFDGGLSSEISANTLGVSDVVYQYKSPLARKVEFIEGRLSADGLSQVYSGLDEPNHEHLKKGDTWFKPNGTDVEIWMYNGEKWEEVASPEVFRQLQADFDELDKQAKEAFEQVDTLVQESPETKRLAQEAQEAVNLANQEITKLQTSVSDTKTALQNAEQELNDRVDTVTTTISENYATKTELADVSVNVDKKITESATTLKTEMSETYAVKSDLTTLQGDYDSFKEQTAHKISQQVSSIQTIQTDTTNAKQLANDAYSKANSASQNANNAVASANTAVSTASQAKSNADKAIADVASLTKTVTTQSTRIDQTSSRIDQVASGVTEVGNRLDNLSVGGRNLVLNSGVEITNKEYYLRGYDISAAEGTVLSNGNGHLIEGKEYTVIVSLTTESTMEGIYLYSSEGYTALTYMPVQKNKKQVVSKKFKMAYYNGRRPSDNAIYGRVTLYRHPDPNTLANPGNITLHWVKIVDASGAVVKDWSPAPEDQQSQIDGINNNIANNYYAKTTVDSKLSTAVSGITAQYTSDINTKLANYYDKSTMDRKLTIDGLGIETYVKDTKSKLDNLQVGSRNLALNSGRKVMNKDYRMSYYYISPSEGKLLSNGYGYLVDRKKYTIVICLTTDSTINETSLFLSGGFQYLGSISLEKNKKQVVSLDFTARYYGGRYSSDNAEYARLELYRYPNPENTAGAQYVTVHWVKIVDASGVVVKDWSPAPEDMATLTQYTEVKQLADRISSTVYDSSVGLVSKTEQLAGKYAIQNLNSYGDVLSSLNLNGGNVRIKGGLIDLDGNVRIQDAFVKNLKANSILANEITAKATNIINARIVNLDASYITSGTLSANTISGGKLKSLNNNMEINLDSGDINFYARNLLQGKINNTGQAFYRDGRYLGYVGSVDKIQQQSPTPIVLCSENDNFIAFMYKNKYGSYNNSVFIDPLGITGSEGVRFLTDVYFKKIRPLGYGDTVEALACIASYYNNYNYPFFGNSSGNSGLLYGGNWLYFMHDGYVYKFEDVKKLINAFVGLGTIQIPRAIASNGTVDRWTTITI